MVAIVVDVEVGEGGLATDRHEGSSPRIGAAPARAIGPARRPVGRVTDEQQVGRKRTNFGGTAHQRGTVIRGRVGVERAATPGLKRPGLVLAPKPMQGSPRGDADSGDHSGRSVSRSRGIVSEQRPAVELQIEVGVGDEEGPSSRWTGWTGK